MKSLIVIESLILYLPMLVLHSFDKYPPFFSLSPKSCAIERIYVPLLHLILNLNFGSSHSSISNKKTVFFRDWITTSSPLLAFLYRRSPFIFKAEKTGGF